MKKSLIFYEKKHSRHAMELLAAADRIYDGERYETYGVSFGVSDGSAQGVFDFFVEISSREDTCFLNDDIGEMAAALAELQQKYAFDSILLPATSMGRMLAPRLAMRLQAGLVADVTDIRRHNGVMEIVRPAFGGKLMAGILSKTVPLMMSVRQNVFLSELPEKKETVKLSHAYSGVKREGRIRLLERKEKEESQDIRDSDVLISGGGGMIRNFHQLTDLAEQMNALVSASRKTVDSGIAPRSIQVGQSGKTVSPKLYMALGINGAIQHIEGLKNVEKIISVNTNKQAPICSISDIVVEGDASTFADRLTEKIRSEKQK